MLSVSDEKEQTGKHPQEQKKCNLVIHIFPLRVFLQDKADLALPPLEAARQVYGLWPTGQARLQLVENKITNSRL